MHAIEAEGRSVEDRMIDSELSNLDSLFTSPDLYVRDVDWKTGEAVCVQMSRSAYARSTFLDQRTVTAVEGEHRFSVAALMDAYNCQQPNFAAPMFIAHTALCGSTLLTRCLDIPGSCMAYREPYLFHNLSGIWRLGLQENVHRKIGRDQPPILDLAITLVSRTYGEEEKSVVKLSDTCTSLLPSILARSPRSRVLLLYQELRRFLVAMLRFPYRRQYVRNMRVRAEVDLRAVGREGIPAGPDLNDGRCAALVWLGLMYPYLRLLAATPARVRSLNAGTFFDAPTDTVKKLDAFFGLSLGDERLEAHIAEGALSRHAKRADEDFDADRYTADLASAEIELRDEIDDAIAWVESVSAAEPVPPHLPNPL
jgi:hypothetical protein